MTYYRSTITGRIFTEGSVRVLDDIYGSGNLEKAIVSNQIETIENPDIIDCLKHGSEHVALFRYRELHPKMTLEECREAIKRIKRDMRWISKLDDK